uniref:Dolichol kinase n=2 Tax=Emiliania huxleyi TaxID=2903 RepID=A0A0D3IHN1_EMIH1
MLRPTLLILSALLLPPLLECFDWRVTASLVSPMHPLVCLAALVAQQMHRHPALPEQQREVLPAAAGSSLPRSAWHMLALGVTAAAAMLSLLGPPGATARAACGVGATLVWLRACWSDGAAASGSARAAAWAVGMLGASRLSSEIAAEHGTPASVEGLHQLWTVACAALVAQSACALLPARASRPQPAAPRDWSRLGLQLLGAALLGGAAAVRASSLRSGEGALVQGLERLGTSAWTLAAWLLEHSPEDEPADGAAHERRVCVGPVLVDSVGRRGGVQSL